MIRPLLVVGPPGSRKSEFAGLVARRVGCRLEEADATALEVLLAKGVSESTVVDVASEVWLDRLTRVRALDRSVVVSVESKLEPDGASTTGGVDLWRYVTVPFRESHENVSCSPEARETAVDQVIEVWRRDPIAVAAGERSYVIDVGQGIFEARCESLLARDVATLFVTDSNVERLYGERVRHVLARANSRSVVAVFTAGEEQKNLATLQRILEQAQRGGIDRTCRVLAFGGGVVTDVGGFVAATWMRGLQWISAPTTLLGMVDASVGGKTAVDLGDGKNAVGAFWQPSGVICDVQWLRSEGDRNYSSALAEVVKTAIVGDSELFRLLEVNSESAIARDVEFMADVVRRCIRVKARVVGLDEREVGLRAVLNLGHTIGHALEVVGGLGKRTHGEAVSLGLVAACRLGVRLGITPESLEERVVLLLRRLGLPSELGAEELREASGIVGFDKKRVGSSVKFVFAKALGDVIIGPVALEELRRLMPELADRA